ncbi:putative ribosome biogenesis protein BOP1 [Cardiosporidium cionae]|uniref:Ribosome biogenesis protein BOP1 homolog n=1 Tax=Cardiosporidium cionae TaxID=476202 RepID=A0ABQ7JE22_9APIC|nr:putative ribosome biogenesis protein BOP1 [Cardiosporidium cionae]|eukprot:KAF8822260.1 putative ribosome biogenesis protein BOP1 [Cardiosporidium cionae]
MKKGGPGVALRTRSKGATPKALISSLSDEHVLCEKSFEPLHACAVNVDEDASTEYSGASSTTATEEPHELLSPLPDGVVNDAAQKFKKATLLQKNSSSHSVKTKKKNPTPVNGNTKNSSGKGSKVGGGTDVVQVESANKKSASQNQLSVNFYGNPDDENSSVLDTEDDEVNRIGNVPLWWYNDADHIGYTLEGKRLLKTLHSMAIDKILEEADNPDQWRTITDIKNNRTIRLTDSDIHAIRRLREGKYPTAATDAEDTYFEYDNPDKIFPTRNTPEPKSRFLPSKSEDKKITRLIKLIRAGKLQPPPPPKREIFDLWGKALTEADISTATKWKGPKALAAPKLAPPTHVESYNPPGEYLYTEEERKKWENLDPEDRPTSFLPNKYSTLRRVPIFPLCINERFDRCLDLYLCPRALKLRMNVDPSSLLPTLPSPSSLRPYPSAIRVDYFFNKTVETPTVETVILRALSVDSGGQWLAVGGDEAFVRIFEVLSGRIFFEWSFPKAIQAVQWHPSLPLLAVGIGADLYIIHVDLPNYKEEMQPPAKRIESTLTLHQEVEELLELPSVENTKEKPWKALNTVFLSKKNKKGMLKGIVIPHQTDINQIVWHRKGIYVAAVSSSATSPSHQCAIHSLRKHLSIHPLRSSSHGKVQAVSFHPSKPWFFAAYHQEVRFVDLQRKSRAVTEDTATGQEQRSHKFIGVEQISCFDIHPKGEHFIVGGANRRLTWFDMELSNKPFKIFRYHKEGITGARFHNLYPLCFSASKDGSIHILHTKVYDDLIQNPLIVPIKKLQYESSSEKGCPITSCEWHPSQPWLFTADKQGRLSMWA